MREDSLPLFAFKAVVVIHCIRTGLCVARVFHVFHDITVAVEVVPLHLMDGSDGTDEKNPDEIA